MAFVALVGLYACIVRRLRTEKRNAAHFLGLLQLLRLLLLFVLCFVLWLLLGLLCSCCLWVSLGLWVVLLVLALFSLRMIATKKKGQAVALVLSSFVGCCYSFANML